MAPNRCGTLVSLANPNLRAIEFFNQSITYTSNEPSNIKAELIASMLRKKWVKERDDQVHIARFDGKRLQKRRGLMALPVCQGGVVFQCSHFLKQWIVYISKPQVKLCVKPLFYVTWLALPRIVQWLFIESARGHWFLIIITIITSLIAQVMPWNAADHITYANFL